MYTPFYSVLAEALKVRDPNKDGFKGYVKEIKTDNKNVECFATVAATRLCGEDKTIIIIIKK